MIGLRTYREGCEHAVARIEELIYADGVTFIDDQTGERITITAPDRRVMRIAAELSALLAERERP